MPKAEEGKMATNTPSKQETWEKLAEKEIGRLQKRVGNICAEHVAETKDKEEIERIEDAAALMKILLSMAAREIGHCPLFAETKEVANWDIYLSGLRGLLRDHRRSHCLTAILPCLGMKELAEKESALVDEGIQLLHHAEVVLKEFDSCVAAHARAAEIAKAHQASNPHLEALYASLKTWETDNEVEEFAGRVEALLDMVVEVIVEGPIQLYLMLSRDGFTLVLRGLMMKRLGDRDLQDEDLFRVMTLHDQLHTRVEQSETIALLQTFAAELCDAWITDWKKRQRQIRGLLPSQALRDSFIDRYERGEIFGPLGEKEEE